MKKLKTSDFDFDLPESFIAQDPVNPRDSSKMMVVGYDSVQHKRFRDLIDYLKAGDVLVVNESKVIPARLKFRLNDKEVEIFVLRQLEGGKFKCLVRPGKHFGAEKKLEFEEGVSAYVSEVHDDGARILSFSGEGVGGDEIMQKYGSVPLPPYIKHSSADFSQYQTVYAGSKGSVAAPTAGLHFTPELLEALAEKGVKIVKVTLHVGRGTFLPVKSENVDDHKMHSEWYSISSEAADCLNAAIKAGERVVAVGTTSVRVLESNFEDGKIVAGSGETDIFIYPGEYEWKVVDCLITNFHLPKSSLIMLVASFLENLGVENSVERVLELYEVAKKNQYRFYSFGDAMFLTK